MSKELQYLLINFIQLDLKLYPSIWSIMKVKSEIIAADQGDKDRC